MENKERVRKINKGNLVDYLGGELVIVSKKPGDNHYRLLYGKLREADGDNIKLEVPSSIGLTLDESPDKRTFNNDRLASLVGFLRTGTRIVGPISYQIGEADFYLVLGV